MSSRRKAALPGRGGLAVDRASDAAFPLSLDDAMSIGLARNVRLKYDRANMRAVKGDTLGVLSALIPNLSVNAQSNAQEINLAALGFKPSLIAEFPPDCCRQVIRSLRS